MDTLIDINVTHSLGAIASCVEKNAQLKRDALNNLPLFKETLQHLRVAFQAFQTGEQPALSELTMSDVRELKRAPVYSSSCKSCCQLSELYYW